MSIDLKKGFLRILKDIDAQARRDKAAFAVYIVLRLLVIVALVLSCLKSHWENVFTCALSLVLFTMPAIIEKNFKVELPSALEITILLFVFAAEILGEIQAYYIKYFWWDTLLHTINGILCAAVGFALLDIINRNSRIKFTLSPIYLAITAFCFSMTIGVLWEFFECFADMVFLADMQKDTILQNISTVSLDLTKSNQTVVIKDVAETIIKTADGKIYNLADYGINGYLDVGIVDTMKDLIVNFVGALIFSVIGYFYVKTRGKGKIANNLIPKINDSEDVK